MAHVLGVPKNYEEAHFHLHTDMLFAPPIFLRYGTAKVGHYYSEKSYGGFWPIMLGEAPLAQQFSKKLFEEGMFAMEIGFPTVPKGKARVRVMNSAAHSPEDLETALAAFERVGKSLGVIS